MRSASLILRLSARPALGLALMGAVASQAIAGQSPPASEAPPGVIGYPASFFAAMRPDTAYDMVLRVPGFTFDDGSAVRGLAGAAGNVLIDGQRPPSKTDDLVASSGGYRPNRSRAST
jgi:hypothetical protein